ncbi:MAG: Flp family type IVb pilin [Arenimonas sp.]
MMKSFLRDESGQDIVEYSLLLCLVGAAALLIVTLMGESISSIFNKIAGRLNQADAAIPE